jgi:glycosyltransferase involved in cell wall biosynthesis
LRDVKGNKVDRLQQDGYTHCTVSLSISVIIPNLHSPLIGDVIAAIAGQTGRRLIGEILVVGQDRYGLVKLPARHIETPRPVSAARARNLGAAAAQGDYLVFIDSDCIAAPELIDHFVPWLQAGSAVVCGGVTIETGEYWSMCDDLLVFADYLDTSPAGERTYVPSLNLCIQRSLFRDVGGFDERFSGAAGEDIDLSLRLRTAGITLAFEPRARVTHRHRRATPRAVWEHLRAFGRVQATIWRRHTQLMPPPLPLERLRALSPALRVVAPLLATRDVAARARRASHLLPGMVWARTAWYWGVAEGVGGVV